MKQTVFENVGLNLLEQIQIAGRVYYRWLFLSAVASTLQCSGHQIDVCFFSDRGYIPITFDDCSDFLSRHNLKNVPVAARFGYEMLKNGLKVARRFHATHLDRAEFSTLTLLMFLKGAKEILPKSREINKQISILFREMQDYYQENYSDVPLRLGTLVLFLNDINKIKQKIHEFALILALSGYNIILPRLLNRYDIC
ncbi:hypothetical protein M3Y96_00505100 [Aphelenchoides besseyi]|nr:hypothetical protein M3Y96_00505100 [Aphelenchoides besseyi]